eukprot:797150-Prymnesium_polylepis.1
MLQPLGPQSACGLERWLTNRLLLFLPSPPPPPPSVRAAWPDLAALGLGSDAATAASGFRLSLMW